MKLRVVRKDGSTELIELWEGPDAEIGRPPYTKTRRFTRGSGSDFYTIQHSDGYRVHCFDLDGFWEGVNVISA